jgi:class 3 adenylate cyclase/tetratricopeptide (TPR) repeat protein
VNATRAVERRIVSVLFADLVGFTALSERLDAEDVAAVQDAYFAAVRETVDRHGGLLEKFVGDAAMAVFGAPRVHDDDAERAVRAGLALVAAVERVGASLGLDAGVLRLRVGVNSGEAIYGEATADRGAVTGDTVNVAARLQTAAEPGSVVVGELTALAVAEIVELEPIEPLTLKGKAEPVRAFRAAGVHPERSRDRALGALRAAMVGREDVLAHLAGAIGEQSRLVLVIAPPGVGKTRLLDELAARAANEATVLRCRLRPDLLSPFEPIGQLVRSVATADEIEQRLRAAGLASGRSAVLAEALRALVAPITGSAVHAADDRDRLFAAWTEGLEHLAERKPAVWLVEDVHWASADLLAFVAAAHTSPSAAGRLIVATARPILLESAEAWCAGAATVELPPLPAADARALVHALVGDALPAELVERIAEASGGNPLFVEELLRSWVGAGALTEDDGTWRLGVPAHDAPLPATVQALYAGQLDDLPDVARVAARRASIAGRRFATAAFEPLGIENGDDAVGVLARRGFVNGPLDDPTLGESFVYRHALLRDAGYASLARRERAGLHLSFAEWLAGLDEELLPTLAEVIARHYAAALDSAPSLARDVAGRSREELAGTAAAWFERASAVASGFAAWESAYELSTRAVDLTAAENPLALARRLEQLGVAAADAVGVERAEPVLRDALELWRSVADDPVARRGLASTAVRLGHLLRAQTRFVEAIDLAEAVLAEVGDGDALAYARLLLLRGRSRLDAWDDYERSHADAEQAQAIALAHGDPVLELDALEVVTQVESERGDETDEAWEAIERLARASGRWETAAAAVRVRAGFRCDDEPAAALSLVRGAAELARDHGLVESMGWCDYVRAEANLAAGDWDAALEYGLRAIDVGERWDYHRVVVRSWFALLPIATARGRRDLVQRAFLRFDARRGSEPDSAYARVIATAAHVRFAEAGLETFPLPDVESRLASFRLAHGGPSWLAGVMTLVEAWLRAGDEAAAERALGAMRERLRDGNPSRLALATEAVLRARLELDRGALADAAREAGRVLELTGAPWWRRGAIDVLERAGAASPALRDEGRRIDEALGMASR